MALSESIVQIKNALRSQHSVKIKEMGFSEFDLSSLMSDLDMQVREKLEKQAITYSVALPDNMPTMKLPREPFLQMLVNLVQNSIEAIEEAIAMAYLRKGEGKITINVECPRQLGRLILDVVDNGVGIESQYLNQVLQAHYTTKEGRMGMGFHSAANLLAAFSGRLDVLSEGKGMGCTVQIAVPSSNLIDESSFDALLNEGR